LTEELIKVVQSRFGHLHAQGLVGVVAYCGRRQGQLLTQRQLPGTLGNHLGIQALEALAVLQRLLHAWLRMLRQQFQDARKVTPTRHGAVPCFQTLTKLLENRWQVPLAKDVGMIQGSGPTLQCGQEM
jgi:hypothetical protein